MTELLVATDLSERSDIAMARAISLSKTLPANLTILYVIESDLPDEVADALQLTAEPLLRKRIVELSGQGEFEFAVRIERGQDWAAISQMAQEGSFDLIWMGADRHSSREMTRGSTIDRVVRVSGRPVLIVKSPAAGAYKHILAAVDFSLPSRHAADLAAKLGPDAVLRLIHVYDGPLAGIFSGESEEEKIGRLHVTQVAQTPSMSEPPEIVVKKGQIIGTLHDQVRDWPADLLVLGTHGRTGVGLAMLGSVAEEFVASSPCDLLVVKAW